MKRVKILASKSPVVVVEIGTDWIKILEKKNSKAGPYVAKIHFLKLAQIKEPVWDAISRAFAQLKLGKHSVITYIPRHLTTVRVLELPATNQKEISDMIGLQVGKQTPYSKEEIIFSYNMFDRRKEGYSKVMLVIVRRSLARERIETLQKAGIAVDKVLFSSECAYGWFDLACRDEMAQEAHPVALLDIDSNYSDFMVIHRGKMIFTKNIFIGTNDLMSASLSPFDRFAEEVKRAVEIYQSEERSEKIAKIFLSGAGAAVEGLSQSLSAKLDTPVKDVPPLKNIPPGDVGEILKDLNYRSISISPLVGAAFKETAPEIDLTTPEMKIQRTVEGKRRELTVMGILSASIALMASLLLLTSIYNSKSYLTRLEQKLSELETETSSTERMSRIISLAERRGDTDGNSINILSQIYKIIPNEIYITGIDIEERGKIVLKGRAAAMSDVFKFVTTLEKSPGFENVKTTYTTTKKEKEGEYTEFEITCNCEDGAHVVPE
jgi:Tfp pilus assembly PilM family ATPase/Tfp pilus assembly protein PilN